MRAHVTILAFLMVAFPTAVFPRLARAQGAPVPDRGAEVALRSGLAIPFGETQDGTDFDQYASSAIPLLVEAGFRVDSSLFVGARFGYAFPQLKNPNNACNNADCSGSDVTLGLEAIYRFTPEQTFAPWVGVGGGYEWTTADASAQNVSGSYTVSGFQGLAMVGGDYRVNQQLVLGPAVELAFGRFDSLETTTRLGSITMSTDNDIQNTAWHTWLTLGLRGAFGF
jgi:outer membrane autotransporter protein